jgi:hypothetical protein
MQEISSPIDQNAASLSPLHKGRSEEPTTNIADFCNKICQKPTPGGNGSCCSYVTPDLSPADYFVAERTRNRAVFACAAARAGRRRSAILTCGASQKERCSVPTMSRTSDRASE